MGQRKQLLYTSLDKYWSRKKIVVYRHREQGTCIMVYGCVLYILTYILSGLSGRKIPTIITPSALSNAANILGRQ